MEPEPAALLQRSTSQLSTTSVRSTRRAKSKSRPKLSSQASSSASSIATSDKSLTSFPSFSPESPQEERENHESTPNPDTFAANNNPSDTKPSRPHSIVESLTSSEVHKSDRNALFEDSPLATRKVPGALHLANDEHMERLIARHGAANLVRQVAEDLAQRDAQIATLRRRADERERALRKIILECGLSSLDLETRLRTIESELRIQDQMKRSQDGGLSDMMNDAMQEASIFGDTKDGTIRATSLNMRKNHNEGKGTARAWKDWLLGNATYKKGSRANSINEEAARTVIRAPTPGERRPPIQEDLFTPLDNESLRSSSRASSIYGPTPRKPSTSLASMALQLVAGRAASRDNDATRGRSSSAGHGPPSRAASAVSVKSTASTRAVSTQGGPKALMAMRRATPAPVNITSRNQPHERWNSMDASPPSPLANRSDNSGPVEMDTIFSPEGQPPTLTHIYNNYMGSEYLTDRFGFIYDQRRKKRQREAAQVARQIKRGSRTEMLTGGRSGISPASIEDTSDIRSITSDGGPDSPNSGEDANDQGKGNRWQDYLKIATFPTELLSHTPSITTSALEVHVGNEGPKSPGLRTTSEGRGFVPSANTTLAVNNETTAKPDEETAAGTLVKEDVEPVKLLLQQLSDVHDALQRDKTVRWNEFLRKVRAERRREGEAAAAAAVAAAEARFLKAPVMIPEAKLTDGEIIGVADLGVKGKVGRAKWNEFRNLVLGGIPVTSRPKIWSECSGAMSMRVPGYYEDLVSRAAENDDPTVVSQIEMDINRTLTDNIFFRKGPGVHKLSEVLRAYARRNPEVGYCQGMNLITANLLLIMPSTEDTFWILTSIIEHILPAGYYDHSLMASRADQHVLRKYVTQVLPRLSQHLDHLSIELEALTFQWFLSVFTDCLSAEALFRVWDVVLCINDGSTFLFQVALALLKLNEQQLLQCDTPAAVYTYINHQMTNHAISIDGLIQASEGLRKVVRPDEVKDRRAKAVDAEKQLMKEREERNKLLHTQKALTAPAIVTEESASGTASAHPSPALGVDKDGDTVSVVSLDVSGDDRESSVKTQV